MQRVTLLKNKLEMEYQALMQERSSILIALTGVPITFFNLMFSMFKLPPLESMVGTFISFIILLSVKLHWDEMLRTKRDEIDKLLK